jgi:hypothetical protein
MIVWLNGTFGVGKTTTATHTLTGFPDARIFDAEEIGYLLRRIGGLPALGDFQHWPPWRKLVAETARQVLGYVGGTLIIPQTVLVQSYWTEIREQLTGAGIEVHLFVLHADPTTLRQRIERDTEINRAWRLAHLARYESALPWLRQEGDLVDTTEMAPEEVAQYVCDHASCSPDA